MRRNLRGAAALALTMLALAGCGDDPPATTPPNGGLDLPGLASSVPAKPATTAPDRPWATACSLFKPEDVLAATDHQNSTITVVDRKENNSDLGDVRISKCSYNTKGVESYDGGTSESTGANWVTVEIKERGAEYLFTPENMTEPVSGLGDEAFWDDPQNNFLYVRSGAWILIFDATSPTDRAELANIVKARRTVTLNVAKLVVPRLPAS